MDPFTESNKNKIKIEDSSRYGGSYEPERWMVTKYRKLFYVIQFIRLSRSEEKKKRAAPVWILNQSSEHKTICQNFSGNIIYRFIYGINSPPISEESYRTPLSIITKFFQPPE